MDDDELLREYARNRSQEAFRSLVDRHLGMVYAAARRMVRDDQLAEEIAQGVFTTLAQKAESIRPPQVVGGWLYNTTRHLAMHVVRTEQRRRKREQTAVAMQALDTLPDDRRILEQLEPAMAELEADDRDPLVLRFLESRSLREVGQELGISEDAARMRVNRALERLRIVFGHQGTTVSAVALGTALTAGTVATVPAGLAGTVATTALAGTALTTATLTHTSFTAMTLLNLKTAVVVIAAAALAGAGTYYSQQGQVGRLRADNQALAAQQEKLKADEQGADAALQAQRQELARLRADATELPRLRAEVTQLRQQHEADAARLAQPTAPPPAKMTNNPNAGFARGGYLNRQQVVNAGNNSPEAALETMMAAIFTGEAEPALTAFSPEMQAQFKENPQSWQEMNAERKAQVPKIRGVQILARKTLTPDDVELVVNFDADPIPGGTLSQAPVLVFAMTNTANGWRPSGEFQPYTPAWEQDGKAQKFGP